MIGTHVSDFRCSTVFIMLTPICRRSISARYVSIRSKVYDTARTKKDAIKEQTFLLLRKCPSFLLAHLLTFGLS